MSDAPATPGFERADAQAEARAKASRIAAAFVDVFGKANGRRETQSLVLAHLAECAGDDQNSYRFSEAKDGLALIAAGIHRDGARSMLRIIERQLHIADNLGKAPQPKPAVILPKRGTSHAKKPNG